MKKSTNYSKDFLENVSRSLSNCLTHFTHNVSLGIINKNFSEAVVNSELSLQIFSSCLLCPILERMFPYTQGSLEEPWHNEFAYQQLITEMLIEHKVRQIGRVLEDKHLKERKMNELKKEIDRYVGSRNPEQAEAYKAIVNMDLIQLETADIKRYLVSSHQFLPVLAKIMRRNDAKSIQIRSGF